VSTPPQPDTIEVTPDPATCNDENSVQFVAMATWPDTSVTDETKWVAWSSSDTSIATVSSGRINGGLALGITPGTVTITATYPIFGIVSG
jgi:hypothetical protein